MEDRYIICIPRGCGFNDVMCQISEAHEFSIKTKRNLIIDTRLAGIADNLSNYMRLKNISDKIDLELSNSRLMQLNEMVCYPAEIEGQLDFIYHKFLAARLKKNSTWIHSNSFNKLRKYLLYIYEPSIEYLKLNRIKFIYYVLFTRKKIFDFKLENLVNNTSSVIIYHQSGGGEKSIDAINLFKLRVEIGLELNSRLKFLSKDYDAIHIRNSDYKTDYAKFLINLKSQVINKRVLLCTDDSSIFPIAKTLLSDFTIETLYNINDAKTLNNKKIPLHYQWNLAYDQRKENNIRMLTDLIGLAKAQNLFYTNLNYWNNKPYSGISGFSLLAANLNKNRKVLDDWLNQ